MAKRSFKHFVEQELGKFPHFVIYALLEWMLIIVLFIDGFLAFFANEFAKFFELKIPCLLCTRIDHVVVHRNADFYYNDSICENHKKDVSSLTYCHVHKKLSDVRKMCDGCLLSFATEKESDCDTYKSLFGILHKDIELFVDDDCELHFALHAGRKDEMVQAEKNSLHRCSCCGEPLKAKSNPRGKNASLVSQAPTPSPRTPFVSLRNKEPRNTDLTRIRYTQLKLSDNESEINDDEDGSNAMQLKQLREDVKAAAGPLLTEAEDIHDDRTPTIARGNRFFGIPLTDSANATPKWATRISRKSPLEKTEYASVSTEENALNEADGESMLHNWKRHFHLDDKSLLALKKELEEERSASAVAANNAMAMIARLQAEKAAVQMEALQYQRMMEEQAEYDEEALQATNDLLATREETLKVLEAELEVYREKYGILEGFEGPEDEIDEDYHELKSESYSSFAERSECFSSTYSSLEAHNNGEHVNNDDHSLSLKEENAGVIQDSSQKSFRRNKSSALRRLKNLEKMNKVLSEDGVQSSQSSSDNVNNMEEEIEQDSKASFMRELLQLHDRVKALEADGGFLKQATAQIQENGSGKETLLTEISDNLQKLRQLITMPFNLDNDA